MAATWRLGGLGSHTAHHDRAQGRERRQLIQGKICAEMEVERRSRAVAMRQQGAWTIWDYASTKNITWPELWKSEPARYQVPDPVYDVLQSPSNLHCWGLAETPACPLCPARGSLEHILSCCPKALREGRYRWCNDQVLMAVDDVICAEIQQSRYQPPGRPNIAFIRAGQKPQSQRTGGCYHQRVTGS